MRIKWATQYVDDQEKALQFYTDKLGFLDDSCGNLIQLTKLTWG
jgi:glyoxalase/bleomycin resistance protein/dioxygenase superfamily protein